MSFRGDIEILALDAESRTLHLVGKGTDSTGSSGASMDLTARIDAVDGGASRLVGASEVSMSGKAAAFGGRMMSAVADQVLKQFGDNFAERARALSALVAPVTEPAPVTETAPAAESASAAEPASVAERAPVVAPASVAATASAAQPSPVASPAPPRPAALNGLALAWAVLKQWARSLFAARRA